MTSKKATPGPDNFEISILSQFRNYVSSIDPTIGDIRNLVRGSFNVYKKISGTIANRPGRKLYDASTDSTVAKCNSGYVWNTSLGATLPIRVANGLLQFYSTVAGTGAWYTLLAVSTTAWVFDTWWYNTDKKDKLLFVGGDTNTYAWDGGVALFVSYAGAVITLDRNPATAGFAASGTVTINGVDYTYTGISGNTLTGTSDATAAVANSVAFSKVVTTATTPATGFVNDFIRVVNNQLYSGSYTSQLVYISKNTDYTDHGQSTPRITGDGDTVILDAPAKGIGSRTGLAHIFYGTSHVAIISFNQITVGAVLAEVTQSQKIYLGESEACLRHEFIDSLSDNLIYLDQANQLRAFGSFRNIFTAKSVLLSQPVQEELAQADFTGGQLKIVTDRRGDLVYINSPVSGQTYLYQERSGLDEQGNLVTERFWNPPQTWNITRVDAIGGRTVGFSNANPQIYYLWDTNQWHDDDPMGSVPYQSIALMSYRNGGRRQGKQNFDKIYWEGYMTVNSNVYGGIYYDYQGSTSLLSPIINDPDSPLTQIQGKTYLYSGVTPPSLGDASLGDNPLGDGLNVLPDDQALLPKFRVITDVPQIDCYEYALMIYSSNIDARWELLAVGTNSDVSFAQAVEIRK